MATTWFRRVMWLGIGVNIALAVPTLLLPVRMLTTFDLPVPSEIMWTRFAALLLILLSLFYIPAATDPHRYRTVAVLAVTSRLAGVLFFFLFHNQYWVFGALDLRPRSYRSLGIPRRTLCTFALAAASCCGGTLRCDLSVFRAV
jgi:hypothetical protein